MQVTSGARWDEIYRVRSFESRRRLSKEMLLKNLLRTTPKRNGGPGATGILRKRARKENTRSAEICKVRVNRFGEAEKKKRQLCLRQVGSWLEYRLESISIIYTPRLFMRRYKYIHMSIYFYSNFSSSSFHQYSLKMTPLKIIVIQIAASRLFIFLLFLLSLLLTDILLLASFKCWSKIARVTNYKARK